MKALEINGGEIGGSALDVEHLIRLGNSFGGRHRQVLVGCWSDEPTARARALALTAGLMSAGTKVLSCGSLPLPALTLLARESGTAAVCTILPDGVRFQAEDPNWLVDFRGGIVHYELAPAGGSAGLKPMSGYFRKLSQVVDVEAVRRKEFAVRVTAQGAAESFVAQLLEKLNCRIVKAAEPCDAAFTLSRDATALRIADYGPEMTIRMIFEHILEAYPGDTVLCGSDILTEEIIRGCGCECFACSGGGGAILDAMRIRGAGLGGDLDTGLIVWRKFQPAPDGILVLALTLEMLALSGQRLADIAASLR